MNSKFGLMFTQTNQKEKLLQLNILHFKHLPLDIKISCFQTNEHFHAKIFDYFFIYYTNFQIL